MEGKKKNLIILGRKRIGEELEKIFNTGLFIVTAQMGYGKTTEVSEFLKKKNKVKTIYVSADFGADDDQGLQGWNALDLLAARKPGHQSPFSRNRLVA